MEVCGRMDSRKRRLIESDSSELFIAENAPKKRVLLQFFRTPKEPLDPSKNLKTFTCFQALPYELQLDIWELVDRRPQLINFQNHHRGNLIRTNPYPHMVHLCRSSRETILKNLNRHYKFVTPQSWSACRSSKYLGLRPFPALILAPKIDTIYLSARSEFNPMALVDNGSDGLKLAKFLHSLDETCVERVAISVSLLHRPGASQQSLGNLMMSVLFFSSTIREIVFVTEHAYVKSWGYSEPPQPYYTGARQFRVFRLVLERLCRQHRAWKENLPNSFLTKFWPRSNPLVLNHRPLHQAASWTPPKISYMTEDELVEQFR